MGGRGERGGGRRVLLDVRAKREDGEAVRVRGPWNPSQKSGRTDRNADLDRGGAVPVIEAAPFRRCGAITPGRG
jgi:hypothetical protein